MAEIQTRILDDLRDSITGDILVDELSRSAYATDASILEVKPLAIVAPRSTEDLVEVVRYAKDQGLRIHPRGAGTGLAGESLGSDLVVDTSRYLTRIIEIGANSVRVEPGVRWLDLQRVLASRGRMFAPDPVSGDRCTIGGMLATDAGGPHSLRYGTTRHHVLSLRAVLADGELVSLGREYWGRVSDPASRDRAARLAEEVADILRTHAPDVLAEQPADLPKYGGYALRGILEGQTVHLARLLVGSEGTLGVIAEAELATLPLPAGRGLVLAPFSSLEAAVGAVPAILEDQPAACELLDRRLLALVRAGHSTLCQWVPSEAEALLLVEQQDVTQEQALGRATRTASRLRRTAGLAGPVVEVYDEPQMSLCWEIRNRATPKLVRTGKNVQPIAFVENATVPPARLGEFLKRVQEVMQRHQTSASYAAHAGVGLLHTRPLLDLQDAADRAKLAPIAREVLEAALACQGTFNGEHGVGLLRSSFLPRQYPRLYPVFQKIKAIFDPHNQLNPGRIVGAAAEFPVHLLRSGWRGPAEMTAPAGEPAMPALHLLWPGRSAVEAARRCNGCAECRAHEPAVRMCPVFKAVGTELSSPRGKANVMRHLLSGQLDPRLMAGDELGAVANLCIQCKLCRLECPSGVDVSNLMLEAKAARVAEHGLSGTDWFLADLERWYRWASANAFLANALLGNGGVRWLMERFVGLSRRRRMPRFHHHTFFRRAARHGWTKKPRSGGPRPKVAVLVDSFVNHNDPYLGECVVRLLEHQGLAVYVPPTQAGSGMPALQHGDVERAGEALERNIRTFADLAREGYDIVSPEPAAVLMLREEAGFLSTDADLELLAQRTYEFSEFFAMLGERGTLRGEFQPMPLSIAYHEPCHQRALLPRAATVDLLRRIPRLRVLPLDLGCSGMGVTFGMRADSFDLSMKIGEPMLRRLAQDDVDLGTAQCFACRMQMEQGSGKRSLHPAHWLALAYGLVHHPERLLHRPRAGLVAR